MTKFSLIMLRERAPGLSARRTQILPYVLKIFRGLVLP